MGELDRGSGHLEVETGAEQREAPGNYLESGSQEKTKLFIRQVERRKDLA